MTWARSAIRVLEADPDLGAGIDRAEWTRALAAAVAPGFEFVRGPWSFSPPPERGALGALVIEGVIMVRIEVSPRAHVELLGEGDVISPWVAAPEELALPPVVSAAVVSTVRIALLDRRFALRTAPWPEIHAALIRRLIVRARRLSLQTAINAVPRIEARIEATLWALGQRLGRVTPEGIALALPLTHSLLAEMVGAQRPSVSIALGRLQACGTVVRTRRDRWLLRGDPPPILSTLATQVGLEA